MQMHVYTSFNFRWAICEIMNQSNHKTMMMQQLQVEREFMGKEEVICQFVNLNFY